MYGSDVAGQRGKFQVRVGIRIIWYIASSSTVVASGVLRCGTAAAAPVREPDRAASTRRGLVTWSAEGGSGLDTWALAGAARLVAATGKETHTCASNFGVGRA